MEAVAMTCFRDLESLREKARTHRTLSTSVKADLKHYDASREDD